MIFKYIKISVLIICVGLSNAGIAQQNLVRNYSFEQVSADFTCVNSPTPNASIGGTSQSDLQAYWDEISYWTCPDVNSPCGATGAASSDVLCVAGVARSGTHYGYGANREYIVQALLNPLIPGNTYYYEYYVKGFGGSTFPQSGIKLYTERPKQCGGNKLRPNPNTPPQLAIPTHYIKDGLWHKVSGHFTPDEAYSWIALGSFLNQQGQSNTILWDDIKIYEAYCPPVRLIENEVHDVSYVHQAGIEIYSGYSVDPQHIDGDVIVGTGKSVIYKAGNRIVLEPGFSTEPGAYFETVIAPCSSANPCIFYPPVVSNQQACGPNPITLGSGAELPS